MRYGFLGLTAILALLATDNVLADNITKASGIQGTKSVQKVKSDIEIWWNAIEEGNIDKVKSMYFEKKFNINEKRNGKTPLLIVLGSFKIKDAKVGENIANFLIDKGVDINEVWYKANALHFAASKGYYETVKLLVNKKADVNAKDSWGETALIRAASKDKPEIVKYLIDHGADVSAKTKSGRTALLDAAGSGILENVKILLDNKVNVNEANLLNYNALMRIINRRSKKDIIETKYKMIKLLLAKKINVNMIGTDGQTPLSLAQAQRRIAKNAADKEIWIKVEKDLKNAGAKE